LLAAIRTGGPLADAKLQALTEITLRLLETRGLINKVDAQKFLSAGYQEQQILEIILAISVKTLSNCSNHIFHTNIDATFESYRP
jgi:alkylhydroperoxidase family enzyme